MRLTPGTHLASGRSSRPLCLHTCPHPATAQLVLTWLPCWLCALCTRLCFGAPEPCRWEGQVAPSAPLRDPLLGSRDTHEAGRGGRVQERSADQADFGKWATISFPTIQGRGKDKKTPVIEQESGSTSKSVKNSYWGKLETLPWEDVAFRKSRGFCCCLCVNGK